MTEFTDVNGQDESYGMGATVCLDVSPYIQQKIAAIAAHRSQYAVEADTFPLPILQELMGQEYFVRVFPTHGKAEEEKTLNEFRFLRL